ncbi:hypothetical protein PGT21_000153 [Puccinia graminis f. sp. tritici]|uniref:Uncharacterized protein n=1 Tax=Puccinia graminis f. sp. tritici TaxID=56615 RepID=A0A5B0N0R4_PUCGR|nr:hypothetical protein PGT21_000153 [Puccinia graminis f. sp. tritici]
MDRRVSAGRLGRCPVSSRAGPRRNGVRPVPLAPRGNKGSFSFNTAFEWTAGCWRGVRAVVPCPPGPDRGGTAVSEVRLGRWRKTSGSDPRGNGVCPVLLAPPRNNGSFPFKIWFNGFRTRAGTGRQPPGHAHEAKSRPKSVIWGLGLFLVHSNAIG